MLYVIYVMGCGVVLLIKHEAKVSAVSCENQMYIQSAILVTHKIHLCTITNALL